MRTVVIGASNSLVRGGVVQGMIDGGLDVVANGSLGHSQSTILPFRLSDTQLGKKPFEQLIIEIATNEQIALRSSLSNFAVIRSILDWTLRWCAERGIGATFVTMPELASYTHAGDIRAFGVRKFLNAYAEERQIQMFDGYTWLDTWAKEHGSEPANCFETPAHMNVEISHAFGVEIAKSLEGGMSGTGNLVEPDLDFEYIPLTATPGWAEANTVTRSTSLGSADLLRLEVGTPFELPLRRGVIVGTVHNAAASTATLKISGTAERAKRLDGHPGDKLILTAWGLRAPVPVDGTTVLEALPVAYQPDLEHNHATIWRPVSRKARGIPAVELAGLVVAAHRSRRALRRRGLSF